MFLEKQSYFIKNYIIKGLIVAILFSAFIYLNHFDIKIKLLDTVLGLVSLYLLLKIPKKSLFFAGFFIGIFWCNWIAYSLEYYDLMYLAPIILIGIGLVYGIIFYLFGIFNNIYLRALLIFGFSFLSPLGFNWLKPELIFINSYLGTTIKAYFALILLGLVFIITFKKFFKVLGVLPILMTLAFEGNYWVEKPNLDISTPQLNIPQELKWKPKYKRTLFTNNFKEINQAIKEKKDLIVLSETAFATALNLDTIILEKLKNLSNKIDIITGSLFVENKLIYNATYYISKGKVQIAKKVVLVPFGEEIPFPKIIKDFINDTFYGGAQDLEKADKPTDFIIKNIKFRNAICYEATSDEIYQDLGNTKYILAISNNAWFKGSIEPTLQNLLLKHYANKYYVSIYNIVNGSKNTFIRPTKYYLALQ